MDFSEVIHRLNENKKLIDKLRGKGVDVLSIKRIENAMVRDMIVFMYTSYQENIVNAILTKVKRHSNNNQEIVRFIKSRIKKINLKIGDLESLLNNFSPSYGSKFANQLTINEEKTMYTNIITGRINVAHQQGNNLQIGSLSEIERAHEQAKHVLEKFEGSMW